MKKIIFFALLSFLVSNAHAADNRITAECHYSTGSHWTGFSITRIKIHSPDVKLVLAQSYRDKDFIAEGRPDVFTVNGCDGLRYIDKNFKIYEVQIKDKR